MREDWARVDAENQVRFETQMNEAKKANAASRDFYGAVLHARHTVESEKLLPTRDEYGELEYRVEQGIKAACLTREDAAVTSQLQLAILKRLDRNRNLTYAAIFLLLVVLSKLN